MLVDRVLEGLQEHEVGVAFGGGKVAEFSVEVEDWKLSSFVEGESGDLLHSKGRHGDDWGAGTGLEGGLGDASVGDVEVEREPVAAAGVSALSDA